MAVLNAELKQMLDNKERQCPTKINRLSHTEDMQVTSQQPPAAGWTCCSLPPPRDAAFWLEDGDVFPARSEPGHVAAERRPALTPPAGMCGGSAGESEVEKLGQIISLKRLFNVPGKSESCSPVWDRSAGALAGKGTGEGRVSGGPLSHFSGAFPRTEQQKETLPPPPQGRDSLFSEFSKQEVTQAERPQRKVKVKERSDETMKNLRRTADRETEKHYKSTFRVFKAALCKMFHK
ncbi:uncharacterized protein LOC103463145 isoform X2 [Poecilia reticulata]|uniref:uncharacterized protein LOC103463145 isoform X2 n=1 Tax=Poecilia reticulata TaxID=8081 RepID=UPI0007E97328|nr:PREDICTED: uncharacterized protein LOC103463145 isoform X2 [Poecilia reticulata]